MTGTMWTLPVGGWEFLTSQSSSCSLSSVCSVLAFPYFGLFLISTFTQKSYFSFHPSLAEFWFLYSKDSILKKKFLYWKEIFELSVIIKQWGIENMQGRLRCGGWEEGIYNPSPRKRAIHEFMTENEFTQTFRI